MKSLCHSPESNVCARRGSGASEDAEFEGAGELSYTLGSSAPINPWLDTSAPPSLPQLYRIQSTRMIDEAEALWSNLDRFMSLSWRALCFRALGIVFGLAVFLTIAELTFHPLARGSSTLTPSLGGTGYHAPLNVYEDILNSSLGFQRLYVINLPERTDHRDALTLVGAATNLNFTFIDGLHGETILDKALPPGREEPASMKYRGSWRAHMNTIRSIVEGNVQSALIFEDDVDFDIRIKSQLREFAAAAQALLQPLKSDPNIYADPTFPTVVDPFREPDGMRLDSLPSTMPAKISPYGDDWDVLWLGHCGVHRPQASLPEGLPGDLAQVARQSSKGFVIHSNDETVPEPHYLSVYDNQVHQRLQQDFPPHTRLVHHSLENICSLTYAVSQRGARSLLYELGLKKFDDNFDIDLREYCDGTQGREKHVCLTVQPTYFDHYNPGEHAFTSNIRFSARLNLKKMIEGQTDFDDQFPDT